jgi:hypothetical protein
MKNKVFLIVLVSLAFPKSITAMKNFSDEPAKEKIGQLVSFVSGKSSDRKEIYISVDIEADGAYTIRWKHDKFFCHCN